jgi:hypothetical protein
LNLTQYCSTSSSLETKVRKLIRNHEYITADDLHAFEADIKAEHRDRRVIGSVLQSLKSQGVLSEAGYVKSTRKVCHGRPIVQWKVHHF